MSDSPLILPAGSKKEAPKAEEPTEVEVRGEAKAEPKEEAKEPDWLDPKIHFPIELFEDRIAIKRADRESVTGGGIILPDSAQEKSMTGLVVGAGAGITKGDGSAVPMKVAVGDTVVFEKHRSMTEVSCNGFTYHICRASDLMGKARKENVKIVSEGGLH